MVNYEARRASTETFTDFDLEYIILTPQPLKLMCYNHDIFSVITDCAPSTQMLICTTNSEPSTEFVSR